MPDSVYIFSTVKANVHGTRQSLTHTDPKSQQKKKQVGLFKALNYDRTIIICPFLTILKLKLIRLQIRVTVVNFN